MSWISVEDRLPQPDVPVLVWTKITDPELSFDIAEYKRSGKWVYRDHTDCWADALEIHGVTHWQYVKAPRSA